MWNMLNFNLLVIMYFVRVIGQLCPLQIFIVRECLLQCTFELVSHYTPTLPYILGREGLHAGLSFGLGELSHFCGFSASNKMISFSQLFVF